MKVDLLFKTRCVNPVQLDGNDDAFVVAGLGGLMRQWPLLMHWSTRWNRVKLALKIALGRSVFFGIRSGTDLVSTGVLALGYSRAYQVEPEAVVIGTIKTAPERTNQGLATRSIQTAMNAMIGRGHTLFYIDTRRGNAAMLRSIEKLGFGQPVFNAAYQRHSPQPARTGRSEKTVGM